MMSDDDARYFALALHMSLALPRAAGVQAVAWSPGGFKVWCTQPAALPFAPDDVLQVEQVEAERGPRPA